MTTLNWTGLSIDASTGVISSTPPYGTYTYTYRASSECLAGETDRKVYLHTVRSNRVFFPSDTVSVCRKYAEALQINQIFGVEAAGTWSTVPDLMTSGYIRQSPVSSPYAGAVVFNGKAAYDDGILPTIPYYGKPAHAIEFYYTVSDGCLKKEYKTVIVITED
ncbi:MAG: hypothetical protein LBK58_07180 [Prevotellaceae bacterium]|jgi:hypothetical protein|nr:hypothetical protein [Prevotellaceae bacterium]